MSTTEKFWYATGLKINMQKCQLVVTICCQDLDIVDILKSFHGQRVFFPMTYLGMTITLGKLRLFDLQPTLDKIRAQVGCSLRPIIVVLVHLGFF